MSSLQNYLDCLPDLGARPQDAMRSADFTLERMEDLMRVLGYPERRYPCIHIAGTNGKGSVVAFCASALVAEGYKVGTFTSPHLSGAFAGIRINQEQIADEALEETFKQMLPYLVGHTDWMQFEVVTALAFLHLALANVDAAVIEVGLGGRLDATNVLTPLVSVITPIDYDHMSILGSTLAEIAREKAGIIKPGIPVVIALQPEEARESILEVADQKEATMIEVGKDVIFKKVSSDLSGQSFEIRMQTQPLNPLLEEGRGTFHETRRLKIGMLGLHQVENAATAFTTLQVSNQRGLTISDNAIRRGFAAARWPGRFEVLRSDPPVVVDGGHSPAAARALRAALDEYFPGRPVLLVIGISVDKNLPGIIAPLRERVRQALATQSPHPRAMPADELAMKMMQMGINSEAVADARQAVIHAMKSVTNNEVVLVCGSVFLAEYVHDSFSKDPG